MKKYICAFLFAAFFVLLRTSAYAQDFYVDAAQGSDSAQGSALQPFKTIQKAADTVKGGDTVIVREGVYYENVKITASGTAEKPIVFRAENGEKGKTVITGADKRIRENKNNVWELFDKEKSIYRTKLERENMLMRVLYNDMDLYMYPTYEGLETYTTIAQKDANYMAGLKNGYYMDCENGYLYVRLRKDEKYGSVNPNKNRMAVSPERCSVYTDKDKTQKEVLAVTGIDEKSSLISVETENAANVVLYGFTLETPGFAGVYVRASNVTVSNCFFIGCACGVKGGSKYLYDMYSSDDVTVEYCDYTQAPTFDDIFEMMKENYKNPDVRRRSNYWFLKKQTSSAAGNLTAGVSYESGGFVGSMGKRWILRNNYIHNCFDGMSWYANWLYNDPTPDEFENPNKWSSDYEMYENRFENCIDNFMETEFNLDGADIHHNEFINSPDGFSLQTGRGKPFPTNIRFHHNIMYNDYDFAKAWYTYASNENLKSGKMANFFKLGIPTSDFKNPAAHMKNEPWDYERDMPKNNVRLSDGGLCIYNNTIYGPYSYLFNCIGFFALSQPSETDNHNVSLKNNIIVSMTKFEGNTRSWLNIGDAAESLGGFLYSNNVFLPYSDDKSPQNSYMFGKYNENDPLVKNGRLVKNMSELGLTDPENEDFTLTEQSAARGAGVQIPFESASTLDAGAVPYGEKWHINYAPHSYGDVNCDGNIDVSDAAQIQSLNKKTRGDKLFNSRADMNFDGVIDEKDAQILAKIILGGGTK